MHGRKPHTCLFRQQMAQTFLPGIKHAGSGAGFTPWFWPLHQGLLCCRTAVTRRRAYMKWASKCHPHVLVCLPQSMQRHPALSPGSELVPAPEQEGQLQGDDSKYVRRSSRLRRLLQRILPASMLQPALPVTTRSARDPCCPRPAPVPPHHDLRCSKSAAAHMAESHCSNVAAFFSDLVTRWCLAVPQRAAARPLPPPR